MAVIGEGNALKSCKMKSLSHEEMAGIRQAIETVTAGGSKKSRNDSDMSPKKRPPEECALIHCSRVRDLPGMTWETQAELEFFLPKSIPACWSREFPSDMMKMRRGAVEMRKGGM